MMYHNALLRFHIAHTLCPSPSLYITYTVLFVATTSSRHAIVSVCPISFGDKSYFLKYIVGARSALLRMAKRPISYNSGEKAPNFFSRLFYNLQFCTWHYVFVERENCFIALFSLWVYVCVCVFVLFSGITYFLLPVSLVFVSYFPSRSVHIAERSSFGWVNEISCSRLHRIPQHRRNTDFFLFRLILILLLLFSILFYSILSSSIFLISL